DGKLASSKAGVIDIHDYEQFLHERCVEHSTAKHAYNVDDSFAVGALARFNNNHAQLNDRGKDAAEMLGLTAPCHNPYANNFAQVVEVAHCYAECLKLVDQLLGMDLTEDNVYPKVAPKAGRGIGLVEVPRGLLVHDYIYDADGVCTKANCMIPTAMNLANVDCDMQTYVPQVIATRSQDQIAHDLEMLVRAYDPCISCSVHLLKVQWT
ncbi:unnamed protein product, partial [marine sediment metagenome]